MISRKSPDLVTLPVTCDFRYYIVKAKRKKKILIFQHVKSKIISILK